MTDQQIPNAATETIRFTARGAAGYETGATIEIDIRRASDGFLYDFADQTFKNAAWITRPGTMTETDATEWPGAYEYDLDLSAGNAIPNDLYQIRVDSPTPAVANVPAEGTLRSGGLPDDAAIARKALTNRFEVADGDTANAVLYDDDGTTPLLTFNATDKTGGPITSGAGVPARRSAGA